MLMHHALRYASLGFPVFPVYEPIGVNECSCGRPAGDDHALGKHPRTSNGLLAATTDAEQVQKWWTQWPNANIGVATGGGFGVVDLDGTPGLHSGSKLGLTSPVVTITGGGRQLWYSVPEGQKLVTRKAKKLAEGVDTRGTGGYVLVPPSLHPNGKRYTWLGAPVSKHLLPPLPALFVEPAKPSTVIKINETGWETKALEEMRKGHVHNTLISVLGKFRNHNFSEESTYQFLLPHALVDGKPYEGLRDKIAEIWRRYPAAPSSVQHKAETIGAFLQDMEDPEWICKPFVAKKSFGFVVGLPETLKTWLCIDLAVESARENGIWLGLFPVTSCRVLFVDQERWKGETQRRFNAVLAAKGLGQKDLQNNLFIQSGTTTRLNLDASFQAFRTSLLDLRPELVIIDSFATFHSSTENDRSEIQKVMERIKELRNEIGCTFLFINHESKMAYASVEDAGDPNMGTMVGSIGIAAAAEFVLTVRKVESGMSLIWHTKSTLAQRHRAFYASVTDVNNGIVVKGLDD